VRLIVWEIYGTLFLRRVVIHLCSHNPILTNFSRLAAIFAAATAAQQNHGVAAAAAKSAA